jgi:hypothetical protein
LAARHAASNRISYFTSFFDGAMIMIICRPSIFGIC